MPTPRPEMSETFSAVEKPGGEHQVHDLALRHLLGLGFLDESARHRLGGHLLRVDALPVVRDGHDDLAALVIGMQQQLPRGVLPRLPPLLGKLDRVVPRSSG